MLARRNTVSCYSTVTMNSTDPQLEQRTADRDRAIEAIAKILDTVEAQSRQLDDWEKMSVASALNSVVRGAYLLALTEANLAMKPIHQPAELKVRLEPQIAELDLDGLRRVLADAQAEPVREFPAFGTWYGSTSRG